MGIHCSRVVSLMRKPRSVLILFVLLIFSLTLAVPAKDLLETTYDESETQPYEGMSLFAIVVASGCPDDSASVDLLIPQPCCPMPVCRCTRPRTPMPIDAPKQESRHCSALCVVSCFGRRLSGVQLSAVQMHHPQRRNSWDLSSAAIPSLLTL